jgi:phenylalanyl-tRNA synthetase beta chain
MKISYNWLKTIIPLTQTAEEISESLTMCGLEVESIEQTNTVQGDLSALIVGQILDILPHPNADKLQLTQVQINENTVLPIVCGAKNIAVGQKVVVAPVGATLYPMGHEPFKIKSAKIRGEVSEGMICAEDEIGVGKSHEGIIVLSNDIEIGTKLSTLYQNESDQILEIAILPNRGDAISHLGLARELRALTGIRYQAPSVLSHDYRGNSELKIENNTPENCLRYTAVCLKNVKVAPSPQWLQSRLKAIGLNPINNVVDITNFIQHDIGQPLHAFDYAKINQKKMVIRMAEEGEKLATLDGVERTLMPDQLIIADGKIPMA